MSCWRRSVLGTAVLFMVIGLAYSAGRLGATAADEKPGAPTAVGGAPRSLPPQNEAAYVLPFQGRLTDEKGAALKVGDYDITFSFYEDETNGTAKLSRTLKTFRVDTDGIVETEIQLSGAADFSETLIDGRVLYLGVRVDPVGAAAQPRPEMSPRIKILPVLFAKNAGRLSNHCWAEIDFRLRRLERMTNAIPDPQVENKPDCMKEDYLTDYIKRTRGPGG